MFFHGILNPILDLLFLMLNNNFHMNILTCIIFASEDTKTLKIIILRLHLLILFDLEIYANFLHVFFILGHFFLQFMAMLMACHTISFTMTMVLSFNPHLTPIMHLITVPRWILLMVVFGKAIYAVIRYSSHAKAHKSH